MLENLIERFFGDAYWFWGIRRCMKTKRNCWSSLGFFFWGGGGILVDCLGFFWDIFHFHRRQELISITIEASAWTRSLWLCFGSAFLSASLCLLPSFLSDCGVCLCVRQPSLSGSVSVRFTSAIGAEFRDLILDSPISRGDGAPWKNCDMSTRTRLTAEPPNHPTTQPPDPFAGVPKRCVITSLQ